MRVRERGDALAWGLCIAMAAAAVPLALGLDFAKVRTDATALLSFTLLTLGFASAERLSVRIRSGGEAMVVSPGEIPLVVGLVFADPLTLILARVLGPNVVLASRRQLPRHKRVFNLLSNLLDVLVALYVWQLIGAGPETSVRTWAAAIAATAGSTLASHLAIRCAMRIADQHLSLRQSIFSVAASLVAGTFGLTAVLVASVDLRALWVMPVLALPFLAGSRAVDTVYRRQESLQRLSAFSGRVVDGHVQSVARDTVAEVRTVLRADVAELVVGIDGEVIRVFARGDEVIIDHAPDEALARRLALGGLDAPLVIARRSRRKEERALLEKLELRDVAVAALVEEGATVGTLLVANHDGDVDTFDRGDLPTLSAIGNHALIAMRRGRLADQLRVEEWRRARSNLQDPLTGLPNRRAFDASLTRVLDSVHEAAVLLLDLDGFRRVNDTLGHDTGDELLLEVTRRLRQALPARALAARIGADVFVVCLPTSDAAPVLEAVQDLRVRVGGPALIQGHEVEVRLSVGVAMAPEQGHDAATLLRHAEVAAAVAKREHSPVEVYHPERDGHSMWQLSLVGELRRAIAEGDLSLDYQPQLALRSRGVVGVEALVRWEHPRRGRIAPDEFIGVAEEHGLIDQLTEVVLDQALEQVAEWNASGRRLHLAVNLSARSLRDPGLADRVEEALTRRGVPAELLTFEITESCVMEDPQRTQTVLGQLTRLGVQCAVDDFGTGYSSLAYLAQLPVHEIKIDRSFVARMAITRDAETIVSAIAGLGRRLGCRVVAEGIEDAVTEHQLREMDVDVGQGFAFAAAQPAAVFLRWLEAYEDRGRGSALEASLERFRT